MLAKFGRENAHKACQYYQIGLVTIDQLNHFAIERLAVGKIFVVERFCGNAALGRPSKACGIGFIAEHGCDAGVRNLGVDDGLHIAAAAGNQDNNVFHDGGSNRIGYKGKAAYLAEQAL